MSKILKLDFEKPDHFNRWQDFIYARDDTRCSDLAQWRQFFKELIAKLLLSALVFCLYHFYWKVSETLSSSMELLVIQILY